MPDTQELLRKIQALPPERQGEVESFVGFLGTKTRRRAALDHLLALAPVQEAAGVSAITETEIQGEADAFRDKWRTRSTDAHRS